MFPKNFHIMSKSKLRKLIENLPTYLQDKLFFSTAKYLNLQSWSAKAISPYCIDWLTDYDAFEESFPGYYFYYVGRTMYCKRCHKEASNEYELPKLLCDKCQNGREKFREMIYNAFLERRERKRIGRRLKYKIYYEIEQRQERYRKNMCELAIENQRLQKRARELILDNMERNMANIMGESDLRCIIS